MFSANVSEIVTLPDIAYIYYVCTTKNLQKFLTTHSRYEYDLYIEIEVQNQSNTSKELRQK